MQDRKKFEIRNLKFEIIYTTFLILAGALARLFPHPPNFTPVASIALFGGRELPKKLSLLIPIVALALSDAIIGFYNWKILISVYVSFTISVLMGWQIRERFSTLRMLKFAILSSIVFFCITNFAVWAFSPLYQKTFQGLIMSYYYALPFFRNELTGTIFYAIIIFGANEAIKIIFRRTSYASQNSN